MLHNLFTPNTTAGTTCISSVTQSVYTQHYCWHHLYQQRFTICLHPTLLLAPPVSAALHNLFTPNTTAGTTCISSVTQSVYTQHYCWHHLYQQRYTICLHPTLLLAPPVSAALHNLFTPNTTAGHTCISSVTQSVYTQYYCWHHLYQ